MVRNAAFILRMVFDPFKNEIQSTTVRAIGMIGTGTPYWIVRSTILCEEIKDMNQSKK